MRILALIAAIVFVSATAHARTVFEPRGFSTPEHEQRYRTLVDELRCLVCQNQTIADSNAPLAADLRREIREMMGEGASRSEVVEFLVARYGDFVLYRPRLKPSTWALWGAPAIFVVIGMVVFTRILRKRIAQPLDEQAAR